MRSHIVTELVGFVFGILLLINVNTLALFYNRKMKTFLSLMTSHEGSFGLVITCTNKPTTKKRNFMTEFTIFGSKILHHTHLFNSDVMPGTMSSLT